MGLHNAIGFQLPCGTRHEYFQSDNGGNGQEHAAETKQDRSASDRDHHHQRMQLYGATQDLRLVDGILDQLRQRHRRDHPDCDAPRIAHRRQERVKFLRDEA
jgi:hypothetical protein